MFVIIAKWAGADSLAVRVLLMVPRQQQCRTRRGLQHSAQRQPNTHAPNGHYIAFLHRNVARRAWKMRMSSAGEASASAITPFARPAHGLASLSSMSPSDRMQLDWPLTCIEPRCETLKPLGNQFRCLDWRICAAGWPHRGDVHKAELAAVGRPPCSLLR